ncbi:CHC2 zinc finger domain-containing protein [Ornithinimicrobium flavum]|uniref:CHC2 zinc finger domain-containing protein n=1 Tax=Ornithinimicrobium flavum TaxID=1288636 RepID=UPI001EE9A2C5|nr:CHC2 zinc finger domain-containing protein [Ornithinimicrobium flavum]
MPFHDEKTPSFHVRPAVGTYHCFGCGEGGDVIAFLQAIDHLTFAESVERLADQLGITLRYEETGPAGGGRATRLRPGSGRG